MVVLACFWVVDGGALLPFDAFLVFSSGKNQALSKRVKVGLPLLKYQHISHYINHYLNQKKKTYPLSTALDLPQNPPISLSLPSSWRHSWRHSAAELAHRTAPLFHVGIFLWVTTCPVTEANSGRFRARSRFFS